MQRRYALEAVSLIFDFVDRESKFWFHCVFKSLGLSEWSVDASTFMDFTNSSDLRVLRW